MATYGGNNRKVMKEGKKKTTFLNQMALISQWERIQE